MLAFPVPRTCSPFPVASRRGRKHTALLFCSAGPRVTWASVPGQCVAAANVVRVPGTSQARSLPVSQRGF